MSYHLTSFLLQTKFDCLQRFYSIVTSNICQEILNIFQVMMYLHQLNFECEQEQEVVTYCPYSFSKPRSSRSNVIRAAVQLVQK